MNKSYLIFAFLTSPLSIINAQTIGDTGKTEGQVTVIEPVKETPEIKSAQIDDERFELGPYAGLISLEDFNTVSMVGVNANFHISKSWLISSSYGKSGPPEATFESTFDGDFVRNREDGFQYLAISGGYELFEGRSFFGNRAKFATHLYFDFGVESVEFNGENQVGGIIGTTYKFVANDWLTCDLRMRDHIVERTFEGQTKLTQNLEFTLGLSALF